MSSYNLAKRADRNRLRNDIEDQLLAIQESRWPRDLNDSMWIIRSPLPGETTPDQAKRILDGELHWLKDVEFRIGIGQGPSGWEK